MMRIVALAVAVSLLSPVAIASAGSPSPLGNCHMRLRERDTIHVRFIMRTPNPGREWRLRIFDEGKRVFARRFRTNGEGDFIARTEIRRRRGFRRYEGRTTEIGTGVVCRVVIRT
jgi:hypothetical protein